MVRFRAEDSNYESEHPPYSDDFFNKNGVYQLCFRQSKLNDCTIWYHSNGAVVWCSRLKSQNGAVVDGTIVVFYGTSDRLD